MNLKVMSVFTVGLLFLLALLPFEVGAEDGIEQFKKPMPKLKTLTEEEAAKQFVKYDDVPLGDKTLAYSVDVPLDWQKATDVGGTGFEIDSKVFGEIAKFYGPPRLMGQRSRFNVQVIGLEYQLTAEQWFLQYLLANGYSVQGFRAIDEEKAEALFVLIENRISYIIRAKAWINGKRVVLAQYYLPIENWDEGKTEQEHMVSSFEIKNKDEQLVEEMSIFRFLDVAELKYPSSWELRPDPMRSIDSMSAKILNISSKEDESSVYLDGRIDIELVSTYSAESQEEEKEKFKHAVEEHGVTLMDPIEADIGEIKFNNQYDYTSVETFHALDSGEASLDYELWLVLMRTADYYYFVSLLTPTRENDFYTWSRNTQTLKLVLANFVPLNDSLIDR